MAAILNPTIGAMFFSSYLLLTVSHTLIARYSRWNYVSNWLNELAISIIMSKLVAILKSKMAAL